MKNNEALRCLLCKKPKCSLQGCPVHTPVPECMALYRADKLDEAGAILFQNNPLSAITSQVCDWRQFCYGNCVLNVKKIPVRWYEIEQEISDRYLFQHRLVRVSDELKGRRIALVGTGPVGLASAVWLYQAGAEITLYDANLRLGGVLRYGIPGFRLNKKYVDVYESMFFLAGMLFRGGVKVGRDISLAELSASYDAVLVGAGAEKPATLNIPGEERSVQALPFLKDPSAFKMGPKVIVIGGGNVAMDACRMARSLGYETWVYYRKTFENMPANPGEVEAAQYEGVRFKLFQAPVELKEDGVVFRDCVNDMDADGKIVTRILDDTDHFVPCDTLITAISERPDYDMLKGLPVKMDASGKPVWNEDQKLEGLPNVWVAGDFCLGATTVVEAVASARVAVENIKQTL